AAGARAVVVDGAGELGFAGSRAAGEQNADVERRDERQLLERGGQRLAGADDGVDLEEMSKRLRSIALERAPAARQEARGERGDVAREKLGATLILGREGAELDAVLEVDDPENGRDPDGAAQNGLELLRAHASPVAKAGIGESRRRDDRFAGGQRLGD